MWEPGTLDAAASGFNVVEGLGVSGKGCLRGLPGLPVDGWFHHSNKDAAIPVLSDCFRHSDRPPLVGLELAPGMVSETGPTVSPAEGAKP